jgi:hypothetical protein
MNPAAPRPRPRRWPLVAAILVLVLGGLWGGLWYAAAGVADRTIAGWKAREAKAGRVYSCASQTIGGFPFGIEVQCADVGAEVKSNGSPFAVKAKDLLISARVWQPTVLTSEIVGPLTVAAPGQPASVSAHWRRAQTEVRGLPASPERVSIRIEQPGVDRAPAGQSLFKATRLELNGRMVSGTVHDRPVIEIVLHLVAAMAPNWHPAAAKPVDADITAVLRGLKDFAPEPWPARLRELQAAGGRIDIAHARVRQGDTIAVAKGVLGLSPSGRLDGELQLTVANLEQFLPALELDRMVKQQNAPRELENAFGALDRIMPGLGNVARQNAGPMIVASINMMGQPTELEGQRAVILPLRFNDGAVSLGPVLIGLTPPLF